MTPRQTAGIRDSVPTRRLPILYLGFAHVSLATAAAVVAFAPRSVTGFYYHPLMLGVVHLVILGWITGSIFGALFIVVPIALGTPMPARRLDYWSYAFFVIGVVGMVSHFWIEKYSDMVTLPPETVPTRAVAGRANDQETGCHRSVTARNRSSRSAGRTRWRWAAAGGRPQSARSSA